MHPKMKKRRGAMPPKQLARGDRDIRSRAPPPRPSHSARRLDMPRRSGGEARRNAGSRERGLRQASGTRPKMGGAHVARRSANGSCGKTPRGPVPGRLDRRDMTSRRGEIDRFRHDNRVHHREDT